ncbi:MAG: YdcF family protein [bacterium]|nr:YdcF family protein [bacterium]
MPDTLRQYAARTVARGASLFIGLFLVVSMLLRLRSDERADPTIWLFDLRRCPDAGVVGWLVLASLTLIGFAVYPWSHRVRRLTTVIAAIAAVIALANAASVIHLHALGHIDMAIPVPLSLLLALMFVGIGVIAHGGGGRAPRGYGRRALDLLPVGCAAGILAFAGSIAQMIVFGKTDYRRPATFAVVFGSRVYADGRLSDALADRVSTACDLYESGLTPCLIMSGGPGDGAIHEVDAMRRFAIECGVPEDAIVLDRDGLNTTATVERAGEWAESMQAECVLMVSHGYHLPRIKLECDRIGLEAATVPASESYLLTAMPWFMAREVAAQWVYLVRPLL